jgi:hypothetical protein
VEGGSAVPAFETTSDSAGGSPADSAGATSDGASSTAGASFAFASAGVEVDVEQPILIISAIIINDTFSFQYRIKI